MSYLGYVHFMESFLKYRSKGLRSKGLDKKVKILEIGVDSGQTTIPLLANIVHAGLDFEMICVDIRQNDNFIQQVIAMPGVNFASIVKDCTDPIEMSKLNYNYVIENSLDFFPKMIMSKETHPEDIVFDLVLLDGDHNYETVSKELRYISKLVHKDSVIVVDDYHGRYATSDGFYADSDKHTNLDHKDLKRNEEKQGVKNAVDDFVKENPEFFLYDFGTQLFGEVVVLSTNTEIQVIENNLDCWDGRSWVKKSLLHRLGQTWNFGPKGTFPTES